MSGRDGAPQAARATPRKDGQYQLSFVHARDRIEAVLTGTTGGVAMTVAFLARIIEELLAHPRGEVLVVDRMRGDPLSIEEMDTVVAAMAPRVPAGTRIAYVLECDVLFPTTEYGTLQAMGAGVDMRIFGDRNSACLWLDYRVG